MFATAPPPEGGTPNRT